MSPRFERGPDKRMGAGGRGAGRPQRFSGPKPEWKRDADGGGRERPSRDGGFRDGGRDGAPRDGAPRDGSRFKVRREAGGARDAFRPGSRGERRPFERRSGDGERPYGDRPSGGTASGDRVYGARRSPDRPQFGDRPKFGDRPRFERRAPDAGPSDRGSFERGSFDRGPSERGPSERGPSDRGSFDRRPGGRPAGRPAGRFGAARFGAGRADGPRPDRRNFVAPRPEGGRDRAGSRPLIVAVDAQGSAGEAERHSNEPAADLIWGRHTAQAVLESGRPIHRIWCTPEMRFSPKFLQLLREAKASGVLVEEVTWARLGQLTGGAVHQGIALQTAAAETLDLPTLIEGCAAIGEPAVLMAVDGLTDPHNLGAIVRSAEALGAHGLVLPQRRSAGLTGSVAKVAAGALEHLPVARVVNLNRALDTLKREGYRVVGLAGEGTVSLEEADLDGPLVIVTGSESDGLSMLTRRNCDQLVRIPLRGATPSLNASVATALLLYEVARRGWMKGLKGSQPAPRIVRPQLPAPALRTVGGDSTIEEATIEEATIEEATTEEATIDSVAEFDQVDFDVPSTPEQPAGQVPAQVTEKGPDQPVLDLDNAPQTPAGFNGDIQL
uniref:23S rRNA (guanosine(2251)-2'-O)-methyltransferase RlmB n=1 Tax=Cyanobium sp. TaxID=2164130 RepID=UPI004048E335